MGSMAPSEDRCKSGGLVLGSLLGAVRRYAVAPIAAALTRYGIGAAVLLLLLATPAWARFSTTFAEAASAAPIIVRARVQSVAPNADGGEVQLKIVRTFVRSFAARHLAHTELLPGMALTLPADARKFSPNHEYLILLSATGAPFSVQNRCGAALSQEVVFGTVPNFSCPGQILWTLPEVEARLTQRSVCPEQRYTTFTVPENSLLGRPEVLSQEEFEDHAFQPVIILSSLWFGISLTVTAILILRRRRRAAALVPMSGLSI